MGTKRCPFASPPRAAIACAGVNFQKKFFQFFYFFNTFVRKNSARSEKGSARSGLLLRGELSHVIKTRGRFNNNSNNSQGLARASRFAAFKATLCVRLLTPNKGNLFFRVLETPRESENDRMGRKILYGKTAPFVA